jgi:hypothetical protein
MPTVTHPLLGCGAAIPAHSASWRNRDTSSGLSLRSYIGSGIPLAAVETHVLGDECDVYVCLMEQFDHYCAFFARLRVQTGIVT